MNYRWNWGVLATEPYLGWLLSGLFLTLVIAGPAFLLAVAVGSAMGVLRTVPRCGMPSRAARAISGCYVEIFRNIPLLLQLFLWYFVIPELLPSTAGHWIKHDLPRPEYWAAVVGLGLFTAARVAEHVRTGIEAVGREQGLAAASTGLSLPQAYRYVILPLAVRLVLAPLTSEALNLVKNSSLALTIGVLELTGQSRQVESATFQGIEALTAATAVYMVLTMFIIGGMRAIERRVALPGTMAGA